MNTQISGFDAADAARQTERIVASQVFAKAQRSQRLLRYLVDAAIADPPQVVKEYTLASEVFDRDASYDPAIDATVRVEAGRLRSRLREYYSEEGREDALLIELPKGAYRVVLTVREQSGRQAPDPRQNDHALNLQLAREPAIALPPDQGDKDGYCGTYCFASVIQDPAAAMTVAPVEQEETTPTVSGPVRFTRTAALLALVCLIAAVSLVFLWTRRAPSRSPSPEQSIQRMVPVTTAAGSALTPVFSPDGREIAFTWDGSQPGRYDVYVQLLGADKPLRITYGNTGLIGAPGWSPDGRQIAFSRCDGKTDGVYVVPALGGEERKVTSVGCFTLPGPVIWTNDGSGILMVDRCGTDANFGIVLFSLATGQKRCLTSRGAAKDSDVGYGFALSPDGATILYATLHPSRFIYTVPLAGGTPRPVISDATLGCSSFTEYGCSSMMWTPDGASIVFVSNQTGFPSVWRVPPSGGTATHETVYPAIGSFSKDGRSFAYSDSAGEPPLSIWRADLSAPGGALISSRKVVGSQFPDMDAQPSPDGTRIVWESDRTAFEELWTSDPSGAGPMQLTHLDGYAGTARWSPDGKWVAFDFYSKRSPQIYVIDSEGRNLRAITGGDADNVVPSWSRDGNSIYFASHRTGSWQVWRHSLATGAESQVTEHGGFDPFESPDGQTVYFSRFDQAGIWSVPVNGGPESLVVADRPQVGYWGNWAVIRDGIYFLDTDAEPGSSIEFYRFATRRTTPVFTMKQQPVRLEPSLSATADGKSVYYTQYERQSVIKLMEFSH